MMVYFPLQKIISFISFLYLGLKVNVFCHFFEPFVDGFYQRPSAWHDKVLPCELPDTDLISFFGLASCPGSTPPTVPGCRSGGNNLYNTFNELLKFNCIPIVNENDSVATYEYSVGDNDNLSAIVASLMHADLLILLSDVDGLYTDDPRVNPDAEYIEYVPHLDESMMKMAKGTTGSESGTGGMSTKLQAGVIATKSGCDMVIVNSKHMSVIHEVVQGRNHGTIFRADPDPLFDLQDYLSSSF